MDTSIISSGVVILGTSVVGLIGYYVNKIHQLEAIMNTCVSETKAAEMVKDIFDLTKEKISDKFDPIAERLGRLEDKIDIILNRGYLNDKNR